MPAPEAPDSLMVMAAKHEGGGYTQHYFDSRGVARLYDMDFDGRVWRLSREEPDFTPLAFSQRFAGTFSGGWETDFDLTYRRA